MCRELPSMSSAVIYRAVAADDAMGYALATEENVFVADVSRGIGFVEHFTACAVPVYFAARFLKAVTVTIVSVSDASRGLDLLSAFQVRNCGYR